MQKIIVALALVALAVAAPVDDIKEPPKILRSEFDQQPDGNYVFSFETENGIYRSETGQVKEIFDEENKPHQVIVVRGSYSYVKEDGKQEVVNYVADETGFHAEGDSIHKNPARR